ncbi:hypothetical protein D5F01_LYC23294 [Larimichthys crocea]|uniref:Uncharacterized protein n=1 Tax=Larimichthys crocea TaxID=215358 RepID=A0A6G0HH94_LARCR|nr:hypothetical protein D5F01_LYC23294 [Larimichthys crocea]
MKYHESYKVSFALCLSQLPLVFVRVVRKQQLREMEPTTTHGNQDLVQFWKEIPQRLKSQALRLTTNNYNTPTSFNLRATLRQVTASSSRLEQKLDRCLWVQKVSVGLRVLVKTIGSEPDVTPICPAATLPVITLIVCKIRTETRGECRLLYNYEHDFVHECDSRFRLTAINQSVLLNLTRFNTRG